MTPIFPKEKTFLLKVKRSVCSHRSKCSEFNQINKNSNPHFFFTNHIVLIWILT